MQLRALSPQPSQPLPASATQPLLANPEAVAPAAMPTAAPAMSAPAPSAPTPAAPAAPVEEASFAAKLLGKVGEAQAEALQRHQLLGAVTTMLGQRLSDVGARLAATLKALRGEPHVPEA